MILRLTIACDGRSYAGWQSQPKNMRCGIFLRRHSQESQERVTVHGSGRTDARVHALGQSAHVEVGKNEARRVAARLKCASASKHPHRCFSKSGSEFSCPLSARGKIYRYLIRNGPVLLPLEIGRVWRGSAARSHSASSNGDNFHGTPRFRGFFRQSRQRCARNDKERFTALASRGVPD